MKIRSWKSSRRPAGFLASLVFLACGLSAFGAPIEVNNHSFERASYSGANSWTNNIYDPDAPAGGPDWNGRDGNGSGETFIERIGGFVSEGQAHIGLQNNYYIFQNTGVPWRPNTEYTLTVGVGNRNAGFSPAGSLSIIGLTTLDEAPSPDNALPGENANDQLDNDPLLAEAHAIVDSGLFDTSTFVDVSVVYNTGDSPPAGNIVIFLGDDISANRSHFDNIRLTAIGVIDSDGDTLPDDYELANGLDPNSAEGDDGAAGDPDGDGLTNVQEMELTTDPQVADTDGDGLNDGDEIAAGSDPHNPDTDSDTINDGDELAANPPTDPTKSDTDGDDFEDQAEIAFGTSPVDPVSFPSSNGGVTLGLNIVGGRVDGTLGASINGTAGVVPQSNWNNLGDADRTDLALVDGEGNPVIMRATWTGDDTFTIEPQDPPANIDGNDALMAGHIRTRNGVLTQVTVRNIPYPWYDVYVYADGEGTDGLSAYTVNGRQLFGVVDEDEWPVSGGNGQFVEIRNDGDAGNYMVFRQVVGSTLTITAANEGPDFRAPINGIQIHRVEPGDPSLSPSPSEINFGVFEGNPGALETTLRLTSSGASQTLNISNATITGAAADLYSFSPDVVSSLPAGESQDLRITFAGTDEVGIHRAVLEIQTNDEDIDTHQVQLFTQIKHANGLLAHYRFDESEGLVMADTSGNGYHGRYVPSGGTITLGAAPLIGSGTSLQLEEGADAAYAEVPPDVELPPLGVASFSFWVQQDQADLGTATVLFSRSEGEADPFAVFFIAAGEPDAVIWQSESTNEALISEPFMTPGETFHVVYTYSDPNEDGVANVAVYVNGELNAQANNTTGYNLNKLGPLQLGGTAGKHGLTGRLDDFQIYETVLNQDQITFLYDNPGERAPVPPPAPILLGYWPFDDQATETQDVQAGNHGTVNGGATFVPGHTGAAGDFAIAFDGVDDSVTTTVPLLDNQGIYSISGWIRMDTAQAVRTGLFGQNDLVEFGINGVALSAWAGAAEGTLTANRSLPTDGQWVHIATVSGENRRFLYINGQQVDVGPAQPDSRGTAGFNFNIGGGGIWDVDGNWFEGQIDDVAVFSVALTPDEVAALASGTISPLELQAGVKPPFDDGVLVNGSFEEPVLDNINTNNLGTAPTGWSQTGAAATWNLIRNDGTPYSSGVDDAADGFQILDLNGLFEIFQSFTLTEFSDITFGASFANREGHDGSPPSRVGIYDASGTTLLSPEVSVDTSGDPTPSDVWRSGQATVTGLAPGEYQIRVALNNFNNVDAVYARATPAPTLVGYWPADEGQGTTVADASGNGLDGTLNNGAWGQGQVGGAFEITGEAGGISHVEVPATGESFEAITITGWVNGAPTGEWTGLIQARGGVAPDQPIGIGFRGGTGNLAYTWNDNNGNTYDFDSGLPVPAGQWTFVALTVTPDAANLYVGSDGVLNAATNAIPHLTQLNENTSWFFGKDNCCGDARNFDGLMDEISIWNGALSEADLTALFNGTATPLSLAGGGNGGAPRDAAVAASTSAITESVVVDFGALSGDISYEFSFNAIKGGASTAIAGNDAWALKLDQWNEQGVFGTTQFGVADNIFAPVGGENVDSVFGSKVHVVFVSDSGAGETRLYINGTLVGTAAGNPDLSGQVRLMGARIDNPVDLMAEGSVMHGWAVYDTLLTAEEVATLSTTPFPNEGGGGGGERPGIIGGVTKSAGSVGLSFPAGTTFDVEYSTDLQNWTVIATGVSGDYEDTDAGRSSAAEGYYRGVAN